jgi:hypothetical protein
VKGFPLLVGGCTLARRSHEGRCSLHDLVAAQCLERRAQGSARLVWQHPIVDGTWNGLLIDNSTYPLLYFIYAFVPIENGNAQCRLPTSHVSSEEVLRCASVSVSQETQNAYPQYRATMG